MNSKFLIRFVMAFFPILIFDVVNAQDSWSIAIHLQYVSGDYSFDKNNFNKNKFNFYYSGSGNWSISLLTSLKTSEITTVRVDSQIFPFMKKIYTGNIINDIFFPPAFNINTYVKLPMMQYSKKTGEYNYGFSVTLMKLNKDFFGFANLGYILIANPLHINHKNPLSYGFGIGKYFYKKLLTSWVFYHSYSAIVENYKSPTLLSIGLNYRIHRDVIIYLIETLEVSKSYSENSFSGGLRWNL